MNILYVTGSDTAAMDISDTFGLQKAYDLTLQHGGQYTIEEDDVYAECRILTFGEVDTAFVQFIQNNIMDYDMAKGTDFFCFKGKNE